MDDLNWERPEDEPDAEQLRKMAELAAKLAAEEAEKYFEAAKEQERRGATTEAVEWYKKAAELGHAEARRVLDEMTRARVAAEAKAAAEARAAEEAKANEAEQAKALVAKEDWVQAVPLVERLVAAGNSWAKEILGKAQNNLGNCYYRGNGVAEDYSKAVEWYRKAADQGYAAAQNNLGNCYYNGK
jgi:TPR repeat protein